MALLLVKAYHKVLVTATTKNCVDDDARKIVDLIPTFKKIMFLDLSVLRLETSTERLRMEEQDLIKDKNFEQMRAKRSEFISLEKETVVDAVALKEAINTEKDRAFKEAITNLVDFLNNGDFKHFLLHLDKIREHFKTMTTVIGTRKNLPLHTSLHYHVKEFIHTVVHSYRGFKNLDDYDAIEGYSYKPWKMVRDFLGLRAIKKKDSSLLTKQQRVKYNDLYNVFRVAAIESADILLKTTSYSGSKVLPCNLLSAG